MARSKWSAARPGGHDDTTRSVTSFPQFSQRAGIEEKIGPAANGSGRWDARRSNHCAATIVTATFATRPESSTA